MVGRLAKAVLLGCVLTGLCLPVQANTTMSDTSAAEMVMQPHAPDVPARTLDTGMPAAAADADASATAAPVSIALLLPLHSEALREAAEVVRAGFQAAYEREPDGIAIDIVETGDAPQETLSAYQSASAQHDIVVGPMSRTGVTTIVQGGVINKPTIALTSPETPENADARLPPRLLVMGLSIEEEARQVANWAAREKPVSRKAVALFTRSAWQRRAAKAFELQWQQQGREAETVEMVANDGFLNGRALLQLKKQLQSDGPLVLFLALDARQARQVRAIMGRHVRLYGTSQLNPYSLSDWDKGERNADMDGTRLLDIPWQLQADHPAVMVYPRLVVSADQKRSADLERLYALGIDAYRVAREIAAQHTSFELDGVTGKLLVRFGKTSAHFERTTQQAVYREGGVIATDGAR